MPLAKIERPVAIACGLDGSARALREKLSALPGFRILDRGKDLAAIVTVAVPGWHAPVLVMALRRGGILSSANLRGNALIDMNEKRVSSALRISPHDYNTLASLPAKAIAC
jgi:selenocysteine lyase/cysteine desulfurase